MKLRNLATAVLLVSIISASATAQFTNRSIEKFDAVQLLLDNRKALKLDDRQKAALDTMHVPVKWNIKKLAARIDSAQRNMEGGRTGMRGGRGGGAASDEPALSPEANRARMLAGRKTIIEALAELRREHDSTGAHAIGLLTDTQRPRAAELLKKRRDDLVRMVQDAGFGFEPERGDRGGRDAEGRAFAPHRTTP